MKNLTYDQFRMQLVRLLTFKFFAATRTHLSKLFLVSFLVQSLVSSLHVQEEARAIVKPLSALVARIKRLLLVNFVHVPFQLGQHVRRIGLVSLAAGNEVAVRALVFVGVGSVDVCFA